jgi:uncharacterized protein with GYD domain
MLTFMAQGRFTEKAVAGMIASPEDRREPVARLFEQAGGRLIGWWMTFGEYDWVLIAELPDERSMASVAIAALSGGGITGVKSTLLMTGDQLKDSFGRAGELARGFKSAGQAAR